MPSLAPERSKGLVRRELGFVSFLLLWLLYWNLFNKGYIKKKKKKFKPNTRAFWIPMIFALSFRPRLLDILYIVYRSVSGSSAAIGGINWLEIFCSSWHISKPDIYSKKKRGGNNERKKSKEGTREGEPRGLSSDVFAEKFWPSGVSTEILVHCCASDPPPPARRFLRGLEERKKRG